MRADHLARVLATLTLARKLALNHGDVALVLYQKILEAEGIIERGLAEADVPIEPGEDEDAALAALDS